MKTLNFSQKGIFGENVCSNIEVILHAKGEGGKKVAKTCVHTSMVRAINKKIDCFSLSNEELVLIRYCITYMNSLAGDPSAIQTIPSIWKCQRLLLNYIV